MIAGTVLTGDCIFYIISAQWYLGRSNLRQKLKFSPHRPGLSAEAFFPLRP
jgi:hypothetical protein